MAVCEDAPCCGCCGPAVWAADDASAFEAQFDDDYFYGVDDDEEAYYNEGVSAYPPEDAAMESAIWGDV